jgi:hypothetical protein
LKAALPLVAPHSIARIAARQQMISNDDVRDFAEFLVAWCERDIAAGLY